MINLEDSNYNNITKRKKRSKLEDPDGMIGYMEDVLASAKLIENKPNIYEQPGVEYDPVDDFNVMFGGKSKFEIEAMKRNEVDLSSDFNAVTNTPYNPNYNTNEDVRKTVSPRQYLEFDGENLYWKEEGQTEDEILHQWAAMSGRPDRQSKEYTNLKNQGPIPEGNWEVPISRLQNYDNAQKDLSEKFKHMLLGGAWIGGQDAWGTDRVWLEPSVDTDTQGRDGLTIHGGANFGSIGCIDLRENVAEFAKLLKEYGDSLQLRVKYKEGF